MRVMIAEDAALLREGLRSLLTDEAVGRTLELFTSAGGPPQDWAVWLSFAAPDRPGDLNGARDLPTLDLEALAQSGAGR